MQVNALEFLTNDGDSQPWSLTRAWAISTGPKIDDWRISLTQPEAGTTALPLHDLKRWMLFEHDKVRWLVMPTSQRGKTDVRKVEAPIAMERYLQTLHARLPERHRTARLTILTPAIEEEQSRTRFHDTIRRALPDARVVPEPEMVIEYFRLVQRTLQLDEERNNVILVIDIGAATSNMTIVLSNRGDEVTGAQTGRQRPSRLRAIQGSCGDRAGHWVDEQLALYAGVRLDALPPEDRFKLLERIEAAKVAVSRMGHRQTIELDSWGPPYNLTEATIRDCATAVVVGIRHVLHQMGRRLWEQFTGTEAARRQSAEIRAQRGVTGPADVLRLVDFVLLAGGTSQLRGFKDALGAEFSDPKPRFLEIGESFPVAAAVGALAHVLHEKYQPPRLRHPHRGNRPDPEPLLDLLEGGLDTDIALAWKPHSPKSEQTEQELVVLQHGDPIVYQGGNRVGAVTLQENRGELAARLVPKAAAKERRKGLKPRRIVLTEDHPLIDLSVDGDRHLRLSSPGIQGVTSISLDLKRFEPVDAPAVRRSTDPLPEGSVAFDTADEVVIDFGMSKSVVVTTTGGVLDPRCLDLLAVIVQNPPPPQRATLTTVSSLSGISEVIPDALLAGVGAPSNAQQPAAPNTAHPPPLTHSFEALSLPLSTSLAAQHPPSGADAIATPRTPSAIGIVDSPPQTGLASSAAPYPPSGSDAVTTPPGFGIVDHPPATDLGAAFAASLAGSSVPHGIWPTDAPALRRSTDGFLSSFEVFIQAAAEHVDIPKRDLFYALLGLAVRPIILLSGPPGCGKSTLARLVSHLLGRRRGETYHEVPVQAHWMDDSSLFGKAGLLKKLCDADALASAASHLVLFDEINLTRPEYYLTRFLHAIESPRDGHVALRLPPTLGIGTLNIDDTSRAPSPKILDRCFLVEMDQVSHSHSIHLSDWSALGRLPTLSALPEVHRTARGPRNDRLEELLNLVQNTVRANGLREDLLLSRRALADIHGVLALHHELGDGAQGVMPIDELVDRLISGRLMIRFSGAVEPIKPALSCLEQFFINNENQRIFPRAYRRLRLFKQQEQLGFISPWQ